MTTESAAPPTTNRGVHWTIGGIDWVSATLRGLSPHEFIHEPTIDGEWVQLGGLNGYTDSYLGAGGIRLLYTPGREDIHLNAPGQWLGMVGGEGQRRLLDWLVRLRATFTRIDLQLTDERLVATPHDVWEALNAGQMVTRVRSWDWMERAGEKVGSSVYVGSKSSFERLIVYDKTAESNGVTPGIRWELRARDEAAESLAAQLFASDSWGAVWAGRLVRLVDFREVTEQTNSARRPRLAWFEELVQGAQKMRAYPAQPLRTLDELRHWLKHQVAPSLATVVLADGGDLGFVVGLVEEGVHRIRETHRAMIAAERESHVPDE